ncbi:Crp/Fnr family transcriptional regulator [Roseibacterium beibuensis]|uniref:Crp/Fnr family transcriptional regulator n=1 Tax=[Roseibacterium] beibuensis TaxID=1193142 RepID=UPI00217D5DFF|nr:Crp/Fnr family transcriptional regulator [Roseibacterium beibuensis]MCS6624953.1 Crp/Fnr family transcriptional regulator [Roseibacterium beibuensis]
MIGNFLLDALAPDDLDRIRPHLKPVDLNLGEVVYEPGDDVSHVWFPLSGMLSIVSVLIDGTHVESSAVGRESAVGFIEACGGGVSHSLIITQMEGRGLRVSAARYREAFDSSACLRKAVSQHIELLLTEARQEIACHAAHAAPDRFARWLMVCRDKSGSNDLQMTQEFLATMVATQRTTISAIAAEMKAAGLIRYSRGKVRICDPAGLERRTCECYATMKQFREVMGQPGAGPVAGRTARPERAPLH